MLKIYDSLSQKKAEFVPIKKGIVGMYGCGVTPYKLSHLGHAMQGVVFDVIRGYLEYKGYKVTYVRNYTDVEDRIIERAMERKMNALDYSQMIIDQCDLDFDSLRVRRADFTPKVSDFVPEIIESVEKLIDKGFAYVTGEGNVYFSIQKFPSYGKLSKRKLDQNLIGVRKSVETDKRDANDFALWKKSEEGEISWESPWGKGRPGWHIECSVMSSHYLGAHFDIHGGGVDLIFPHHENEIAQSESLNGQKFVNYWVHNGLVMVGDKKMSKSLNNDVFIKDWLKKYHSEIIRYLILTNHYRSHFQFIPERYVEANKKVYQTYKTLRVLREKFRDSIFKLNDELYRDLLEEFEKSMDNDFNTVPVIAKIHQIVSIINDSLKKNTIDEEIFTYYMYILKTGKVLGLFDLNPEKVLLEIEDLFLRNNNLSRLEINDLIVNRAKFRTEKNYVDADKIRKSLLEKGITLLDKDSNTTWELSV